MKLLKETLELLTGGFPRKKKAQFDLFSCILVDKEIAEDVMYLPADTCGSK